MMEVCVQEMTHLALIANLTVAAVGRAREAMKTIVEKGEGVQGNLW